MSVKTDAQLATLLDAIRSTTSDKVKWNDELKPALIDFIDSKVSKQAANADSGYVGVDSAGKIIDKFSSVIMVPNIANLRARTSALAPPYTYRLFSADKFVDYWYDGSDGSSIDNGDTVIVTTTGGLRFKKSLTSTVGGGDVSNRTVAQMNAETDTSTTKRYWITDAKKWGFVEYDPTDTTSVVDSAMIFGAGTKRYKRIVPDGWIHATWWPGVVANNINDDYAGLQAAIDFICKNMNAGKYRKLYLPAGNYVISNGLVWWKDADANGFPDFITFDMAGDSSTYGFASALRGTSIRCTHSDNFAIGVQFGKGCTIKNISIEGTNNLYGLSVSQIYAGDKTVFFTGTCRTNTLSPYSAIVIDPFHVSTPSADRYPRMTAYYTGLVNTATTGSTDIIIEKCYIDKFICGIIMSPNGFSQNAEIIKIQDCWIQYCADAICNAQSQTRENEVQNLHVWGGCHTIFNNTSWGQGNGVMPNVIGVNIAGYNYQLLLITAGWSNASVINVYSEGMFRLGRWGTGGGSLPISFINCYFDIPTSLWYSASKWIGGDALFIGCLCRQYNQRTGFITSGGALVTFIGCMLSSPVIAYRDAAFQVNANRWILRTHYINCSTYGLPTPSQKGRIQSDFTENSDRIGYNQTSNYGVRSAWIKPALFGEPIKSADRTELPFSYEYSLRGELSYMEFAFEESGRTLNFFPNTGSCTFAAGTGNGSRYRVNDILVQHGITALVDGETGINNTVLGVVTNVSGDTITVGSVTDINPTSVQQTGIKILIYQHAELLEPFVGDIAVGSNIMTNCYFHPRMNTFRPYTSFNHPKFPAYTRIVSIDTVAKTAQLTQTALDNEVQAEISFTTKFAGRGYALQDPNTINFASWPLLDVKWGLVISGSMIENRNPTTNATILGWKCIKTGFLNTDRPPVFVSVPVGGGTSESGGAGWALKVIVTTATTASWNVEADNDLDALKYYNTSANPITVKVGTTPTGGEFGTHIIPAGGFITIIIGISSRASIPVYNTFTGTFAGGSVTIWQRVYTLTF